MFVIKQSMREQEDEEAKVYQTPKPKEYSGNTVYGLWHDGSPSGKADHFRLHG